MENLTGATAAEIDTVLADLWDKQTRELHYATGERDIVRRYGPDSHNGTKAQERCDAHMAKAAEFQAAMKPLDAEFVRRGGWNRYYLVANTNGHVHREMNCNTCFATTQFRWLPTLSDCDETEMVAEWGEMACTVCFPEAPTMKGFGDGTSGLARYTAAEKAARQAEKDAKAAIKAEKAIAAPDGSELIVGPYRDRVRTIVAAERKLSGVVQDFAWYGEHPSDFAAQADQLVAALRARGISEDRIAGIIDRANKKVEDHNAKGRYTLTPIAVAS